MNCTVVYPRIGPQSGKDSEESTDNTQVSVNNIKLCSVAQEQVEGLE